MVQQEEILSSSDSEEFYTLKLTTPPIEVTVQIEEKNLMLEIDTGAAVSIISETTRHSCFPKLTLKKSDIILKTYTDQPLNVMGELQVNVSYGDQRAQLPLIVVAGNGPNLMGRNWLKQIQLHWQSIATVRNDSSSLKTLLKQHDALFKEELGMIQPHKATLHIQADATPKFFKPRPIPFTLKDVVGQEFDRFEKQGVIKKVDPSDCMDCTYCYCS